MQVAAIVASTKYRVMPFVFHLFIYQAAISAISKLTGIILAKLKKRSILLSTLSIAPLFTSINERTEIHNLILGPRLSTNSTVWALFRKYSIMTSESRR